NIRIKNLMLKDVTGGYTAHLPSNEQMTIYDAAMKYRKAGIASIVIAGKEYGTGSSRDWAAKGPSLLGVKAALAQSFERIHRSNLVGMGVLPLQFLEGASAQSLGLTGYETYDILDLAAIKPRAPLRVRAASDAGKTTEFKVLCRIDTPIELEYYRYGGVLRYVLGQMPTGTSRAPVAA
ncbi:MAG: aconitate hydratase, partial [Elusimicrobia bacterium]|nr:aconitate hydratase [Elusimicrobiota bacterium]